jgi:class 3 adenylate cyclase
MAATRRLAAILAADVAGYSRLMGADEEGTLERLKAHRRQLIDPKIGEHRGRIVKTTGDGLLAEFASVVDAVRCAAEVQRGMLDREPDVPDERRIQLRMASTSAMSLPRATTFSATASMSRRGSKHWPSPAGSASLAPCMTRSAASCLTCWRIGASRTSRTSLFR